MKTQATMTAIEISDRTVQMVLDDAAPSDYCTSKGFTALKTNGILRNRRCAVVEVIEAGGMIEVKVSHVVPGPGDIGFSFSLFADEATKERFERYLTHYLGLFEPTAR